ncbi:hypothetical protein A2U01_0066666 [Trifolium medium]|uniref:Uncharacterized protein n=1 Tax=Trifolium medium TaxID=97028 RepID=A0A392SAJ3_9FABA|nr:hypothetical protein [Trifolium medium]
MRWRKIKERDMLNITEENVGQSSENETEEFEDVGQGAYKGVK